MNRTDLVALTRRGLALGNHLRRTRTTSIRCLHCRRWVRARRYNPRLYACKRCAPAAEHGLYRLRRAHADGHDIGITPWWANSNTHQTIQEGHLR